MKICKKNEKHEGKKRQRLVSLVIILAVLINYVFPLGVNALYINTGDNFIVPIKSVAETPTGYTAIYTATDFYNIRNNTAGKYILMADIDLSIYDNWSIINNFSGVLDGNGHSVKSISQNTAITTSTVYSGLIGTNTGNIKNIGIENVNIIVTSTSGVIFGTGIVAVNQGIINNCFITGTINVKVETANITAVGSICAYNTSNVDYCHSLCDITVMSGNGAATQLEVGGIIGENTKSVANCVNSGKIDITNKNGVTFAAGVIGRTTASISDCGNLGNLFVENKNNTIYAGGITGAINGNLTLSRCFNYGHIQASSTSGNSYAGGIAGIFTVDSGTTTSSQNYNDGSITAGTESSSANASAGGIAGVLQGYYHLENCYNNGDIRADSTGTNASAGGIVGNFVQNISWGSVRYSYNTGMASSSNLASAGGILGTYSYSLMIIKGTVEYCYSINSESMIGSGSSSEVISSNCINYHNNPDKMKEYSSFVGFDFDSIWTMDDNNYPYPSLKNNLRVVMSDGNDDVDFSVLIYRADSITSGTSNIAEGVYSQYAFTNDFGTCESLINDTIGLEVAHESWKLIKDTVALIETGGLSVITGTLEEKDVYGAVLLELLQCESNLKYVKNVSDSAILNYTKDISSLIKNEIQTRYNITDETRYYSWLKENQDEGAEIVGVCMKTYGKDPSTDYKYYETSIMQVADATGYIKKVLATAGNLDNAVNQFVSYTMLLDLSESMKAIINRMNNNCDILDNAPLKLALQEINAVVSAATEEELNRIQAGETMISIGTNGLTWSYSKIWGELYKDIKKLHPWMAYTFALYHAGEWMIDQVIADEQYFRMHTVLDVENLANKTLQQFYNDYKNSPTEFNAALLLDMFEIKTKLVDMDNSAAYDYVDKAIGFENWKDIISTNTESAHNIHFQINTTWLHSLLAENPEAIKKYTGFWIEAWKECLNKYPDYYLDDTVNYEYLLTNRYTFGELIEVACPVNVYVYDENNNLVAYATDETVYTSGNISVLYENGIKQFYFVDGKMYKVVCEGYDDGKMDIKLTNYLSGDIKRVTYFQNISVSNQSTHSLNVDLGNQDEQVLYLETSTGNISPSYDSNNINANKYNVFVENGYIDSDGCVSYDCQLEENVVVELTPVIPEGYKFVKWTSTAGDSVFDNSQEEFSTFTMPSSNVVINAIVEPTEHAIHTADTNTWLYNDAEHWHKCVECDERLDIKEHSGGTANCQGQAVCDVCGVSYGELASHNYTAEDKKQDALKNEGNCRDNAVYYYSCSACGNVENNDNHTFLGDKVAGTHVGGTSLVNQSEANHKTQTDGYTGDTKCLGCNEIIAYGQPIPADAHTPANIWSNDGEYHWKECTVVGCGIVIDGSKVPHSSDKTENKVTCQKQAVCDVCGVSYGEVASHNYTAEDKKQDALKTEGNCHDNTVYYYSCSVCGLVENINDHTFLGDKVPTAHVGGTTLVGQADANHKTQTDGYTGDTKCLGCNEIISYGQAIPAGAHTAASNWTIDGTYHWKVCTVENCGIVIDSTKAEHASTGANIATCKTQAKCDICDNAYSSLNANNHVGGTTLVNQAEANHKTQTDGYTGDTKCLGCGNILNYGQPIPTGTHTPANVWSNDGEYHWKECTVVGCGIVIDGSKAVHSSTGDIVATCQTKAVCDVCNISYGDFADHDWSTSSWEKDATGHWHKCNTAGCTEKNAFAGHTPDHHGSATEEYAIKCTVCQYEIEAQLGHTHVFNKEVAEDQYLASKANCTEPAKYYKSCKCGEKGTETFVSGEALGHTEGTAWEKNATHHWHICTVAGCGVIIDTSKVEHTPDHQGNATEEYAIKCSICGYIIETQLNHTHVFDKKVTEELYLASKANCTEPAKYYESCKCGEKGTETFTSGESLGHTEGTEWKSDADNHWHECSVAGCGAIIDNSKAAHTPDRDAATETDPIKCSVCGYEIAPALGHTHAHGTEWKSDKDNHWNECACGDKANTAAHGDANKDGKCDVCEYEVATVTPDPDNKPDDTNKPSGDVQSPQTGDNSMMWLWITLLVVSGLGMIATIVMRKKFVR